jgi:UDPglucose 6-dehydrogenase
MEEARHDLAERVEYAKSNYEALQDADALIIHTEWQPYRSPDFARMRAAMRTPLILDSRNLYDPADMAELGFGYVSIGRMPIEAATNASSVGQEV